MSSRVFYVDDQEDIVWSTARLLARERPSLRVEAFTDPAAALEAMRQEPPDVLITDLRMDEMSGLELMVAAREIVPHLPVIVVTAYGGPQVTAALRGRSLVEYLEKPVRSASLIAAIERLLQRSSSCSGTVSPPLLPDLIQVYVLSRTTGALNISCAEKTGTIWFDGGQIVHAICDEHSGEAAVHALLSWRGGDLSLDTKTRATERTITAGWQAVLVEGCRLVDEAERGSALHEGAEKSVPSTQATVPPVLFAGAVAPCSSKVGKRLTQLATIEGFVGAAVFDAGIKSLESTMASVRWIDLEIAAACNAEFLAATRDTLDHLRIVDSIEDVIITLSDQWHLIRPVRNREGVFVFLVIDRRRGNLAMARLQLAETERLLGS